MVSATVMANADTSDAGTRIGVVAVGGILCPHAKADAGVVVERNHRVDGDEDTEHHTGCTLGIDHGLHDPELRPPATQRRDTREREQEDGHRNGQARGVTEQALERVDLGRAGLAGNRQHDGEGTEVHRGVDQQIRDGGGEGGVADIAGDRQRRQHVARLGDTGVGEHADQVGLAQGDQVADGHRGRSENPDQRFVHVVTAKEADEEQIEQRHEAGRLRRDREEGRDRCRGTLVGAGCPGGTGTPRP